MAIITKSLYAGGKMIAVVGLERFCEKCEAVLGQKTRFKQWIRAPI